MMMGVMRGVCKWGAVVAGLAVAVSGLSAPVAVADSATVGQPRVLASGIWHSLAVKADGSVWAWGANPYGQIGDGTRTARKVPKKVLTGVASVAAGEMHSMAVKKDGTLWTWGNNWGGQLGDGTYTRRVKPVKVMSGVASVTGGSMHSLAVKTDGSLWAWGENYAGQLGDGTKTTRKKPVRVLEGGVAAVAAGGAHSLVLKTDGSLWGVGDNSCGQLGNGTTSDSRVLVQVPGLSGVKAVVAGDLHSMAIKNDNSLVAFGCNEFGELGDKTNVMRTTPVTVMTGVAAIAVQAATSFAVTTGGALYGWGNNDSGQIGDGTTHNIRNEPVLVNSGVVSVSVGAEFALAVKTNGMIWSWGQNSGGQLGDGTTTRRLSPVQVMHTGPLAATGVRTLPKLYLVAGKSASLPGAVQPYNAVLKDVTWKSAKTSVVTVDASGVVTAGKKAAGKSTTVTVTSVDGKFAAKCKVIVVKKSAGVKSFKVPSSSTTGVGVGQTLRVKPASLKPVKATGVVPEFASDNAAVAVVDAAGVITGRSPGKATITVTAGGVAKSFVVTVGAVAPTKIKLNKTKATVARGKSVTLRVTAWTPVASDPQTVIWKTSNKKVATVDADGVVTAKKKGKVTITAVTWNGKKVKCVVTVK